MIRLEGTHLLPKSIFLDTELNNSVRSVLENAYNSARLKQCCIRNQHLYISAVPVRQLKCVSGTQEFTVVVYNYDKRVICDNFPTKFSCLKRLFSKK